MSAMVIKKIQWSILLFFLGVFIILPSYADDLIPVGFIQYNAKQSSGGWDVKSDTYTKQSDLLNHGIKVASKIMGAQIDFIATEESGTYHTSTGESEPKPSLTNAISGDLETKWKTLASLCQPDVTQLAYNADRWELVSNSTGNNPLANYDRYATDYQRGWGTCGFSANYDNGRAYNMAYFQLREDPSFKLLVVVVHMPHWKDTDKYEETSKNWNLGQFLDDVKNVVDVKNDDDLKNVNFIILGDMNEIGDSKVVKEGKTVKDIMDTQFGIMLKKFLSSNNDPESQETIKVSKDLGTCCLNSGYKYSFDHVLTNSQAPNAIPFVGILAPATQDYPLVPNKDDSHKSEDHKAIIGLVVFSNDSDGA